MGGFLPVPGQTLYGASKAAVKLLTEGLAAELQGTHVRVSVIFPGAVATNIGANSGVTIDAGRLDAAKAAARALPPAKAARIILEGLERDRFHILVGRDARVMDALYRLSPERATRFIARQMRFLLGG
jgi:short-subunit dehydrogenase